jgi:hypothetical protein
MLVKENLLQNIQSRRDEVAEYEFNNENFRRAIVEIGDDPDLQEFKENLKELLRSSVLEQKKAQTILTVMEKRLGEL